jgi:uncharacterized LabA/DUF88 family protein
MKNRRGKIALFIDGTNLHSTARVLGFDIDFKRLLEAFEGRGTLLRAFYYAAIVEDQEYCSVRPLVDWLDYNGYTVVTKPAKEFTDDTGRRKIKGNIEVELTVGAMDIAAHVDEIVIFSGDGNFRSLVAALQRRGTRTTIVSTIMSVADELRRQADEFIDLADLQTRLSRTPSVARPMKQQHPAMLVQRQRTAGRREETVELDVAIDGADHRNT